MHSVGCLLGSNLSEFPHHQLLFQRFDHVTKLSRRLQNISKAVTTTTFDAHYEKNGLVFYVTMSQQLCDASKILKSEACIDRKSTRLNSSHVRTSRMPSSA